MSGASALLVVDGDVRMRLDAAVVIPTLHRVERARQLAGRLAELDPAPSQVLFVCQDPEDFTRLASIRSERPGFEPVLCPDRSAGAARNYGAGLTDCDVVAFIDDDCLPKATDWLQRLVDPILTRAAEVTTGPVLDWRPSLPLLRRTRYANVVVPLLLHPLTDADSPTASCAMTVIGCNFAVGRQTFLAAGGFSDLFRSPSLYEETELSIRLTRDQAPIRYVAGAAVSHHQAANGGMRDAAPSFTGGFVGTEKGKLIAACYSGTPVYWMSSVILNALVFGGKRALAGQVGDGLGYVRGLSAGLRYGLLSANGNP